MLEKLWTWLMGGKRIDTGEAEAPSADPDPIDPQDATPAELKQSLRSSVQALATGGILSATGLGSE